MGRHHHSATRRRFFRTLLGLGLTAGVGGVAISRTTGAGGTVPHGPSAVDPALAAQLPLLLGGPAERPALVRRFPELGYDPDNPALVQIGNVFADHFPDIDPAAPRLGEPGEALFRIPGSYRRHLIPWVSLFPKPTPLVAAAPELARYAGARGLYVKDEGSDRLALYGNKVRKYEYALANAVQGGARRLVTFGALGSNHCTFVTLAARLGRYASARRPGGLDVALGLYPQTPDAAVVAKLQLMAGLGAQVDFLPEETDVGLAIARQRLRESLGMGGDTLYVEPGGSSTLTVLGHLDAMLELDEQIRAGNSALPAPPDDIFVALGSGATSIGLALGCYLLGWPTRVIATASQDKSPLTRLVVNRSWTQPFAVGHARRLLESSLGLLRALDLERLFGRPLDADRVLAGHYRYDNQSWKPGYGVPSAFTRRVLADTAALGLALDPTFTGKAFSNLVAHGRAGRLRQRTALFWNTHHRFPLAEVAAVRDQSLSGLPDLLQQYLAASPGATKVG